MMNMSAYNILRRFAIASSALIVAIVSYTPVSASVEDLVKYSICDVRVLYLYSDAEMIDWPTLYYLNDNFGCRIDLVSLQERSVSRHTERALPGKQMVSHSFLVERFDSSGFSRVTDKLFAERRSDILIFNIDSSDAIQVSFKKHLMSLPADPDGLFDFLRFFQSSDVHATPTESGPMIVLNSREQATRYGDRMEKEIPQLFQRYQTREVSLGLQRYRLIEDRTGTDKHGSNFLTDIESIRLIELVEKLLPDGPMKITFGRQSKKFITRFGAARSAIGNEQVRLILEGYRELLALVRYPGFTSRVDSLKAFRAYLGDLQIRAEQTALAAVGVHWDGRIILRDSPHGPKLKFLASVSVDGPNEVELSYIRFHPYWDSTVVLLDSISKKIAPHQSYVREFLIDIDREAFESEKPESLLFTTELIYGQIPLEIINSVPVWEKPKMSLTFEPDFQFVEPPPDLDIDRVVSSMNLKAVITKPINYSGTVKLVLETSRGLFAGAYRTERTLDAGRTRELISIPFSISKLFERGVQLQTLSLMVEDQLVAGDTIRVRSASCHMDDRMTIGFLPDSTGLLEDILRMTDASFSPLTDRGLMTADLNSYRVIVVGSGSFRHYPSFYMLKDRLETFLKQGGSLVIFGQPEDWPEGVLPVSFVPGVETVSSGGITNKIKDARVLSKPYSITEKGLLSSFFRKSGVTPADIAPAEKVLVTAAGGSLLSISRIGDGQIIYCGLPLLEMISRLDIEAIHLFSNIMNY